ncbi:hypothetical protein P4O66_013189, partial [Electrophorus voltai]
TQDGQLKAVYATGAAGDTFWSCRDTVGAAGTRVPVLIERPGAALPLCGSLQSGRRCADPKSYLAGISR